MVSGISELITPEIFGCLYTMGHWDSLAIVDANYCASSLSENVVDLPILNNHRLLYEILKLIPLDEDNEDSAFVFKPDHMDKEIPQAWSDYRKVIQDIYQNKELRVIGREEFNRRTKEAYATIRTQDKRLYANIIINKGVVLAL